MADTATITTQKSQADGQRREGGTWSTARAGNGTTSDGSTTSMAVQTTLSAGTYFIRRTFLKFDLSTIPIGSEIVSVKLKFTPSNIANIDSSSVIVVESTADDNISDDDFTEIGSTSFGTKSWASMSNNVEQELTLDSDGENHIISNLEGFVKIALIDERDFNNSAPTGEANGANINSGSNAPQLVIEYIAPSSNFVIG